MPAISPRPVKSLCLITAFTSSGETGLSERSKSLNRLPNSRGSRSWHKIKGQHARKQPVKIVRVSMSEYRYERFVEHATAC
jgi:hypothetical protein